ncbi:MAG: SagB family peptide dehydrogenase [Azonexus sp.]
MTSLSDTTLKNNPALHAWRGFHFGFEVGVLVEELSANGLTLLSPEGVRSRLKFPSSSIAELLGPFTDGLSVDQMASALVAETPDTQTVFGEILVALASRRLLRICWGGLDVSALSFQFAASLPRLNRVQLPGDTVLELSGLAMLHRVEQEMVLDFPPTGLRIVLQVPAIVGWLTGFNGRDSMDSRRADFPLAKAGSEIDALIEVLAGLGVLTGEKGASPVDLADNDSLATWEPHNLFFYTQSHSGFNFGPLGAMPGFAPNTEVPPLTRRLNTMTSVELPVSLSGVSEPVVAGLLRERRSVRDFDSKQPVTLDELSALLFYTLKIQRTDWMAFQTPDGVKSMELAWGPSPTAGACHALEIFVCVSECRNLASGIYAYDCLEHRLGLVADDSAANKMLASAARSMGREISPPITLIITVRFDRVFWKYRGVSMANILRDVGALYQTLYLGAQGIGLAGCAIGNVDLAGFEGVCGHPFYKEGPVGMFALGRPMGSEPMKKAY